MDGLRTEFGDVGDRVDADVAGRASQSFADLVGALRVHPGDGIELLAVPAVARDRGDLPRVVEKRLGVAHLGRELELVGDVCNTVTVLSTWTS